MDALQEAKNAAERFENADNDYAAQFRQTALMYAAIAQAEALTRIAAAIEDTFVRGELNVMLMNGQH